MGIESEKESKSILKQANHFDGSATMRLVPAPVAVGVAVVALRAALLVAALVTSGCGLALGGGGFIIVLLFIVFRASANDDGLVGEVWGLSFNCLLIVFSLFSLAATTVRVLVVGLTGTFACDASFTLLSS